jgi:hypothetical protein
MNNRRTLEARYNAPAVHSEFAAKRRMKSGTGAWQETSARAFK